MEEEMSGSIWTNLKKLAGAFVILSGCFTLSVWASIPSKSADLVLGQKDFSRGVANSVKSTGLDSPYSIAIDSVNGRVYSADGLNNRVLWWNGYSSLTSGKAADGVIGQPDLISNSPACSRTGLNSPVSVRVDKAGNVWVADAGNNRVLKYAKPAANGSQALLVLGQADFVSAAPTVTPTQSGLNLPQGVSVDPSGNVWVADTNNNRVVEYLNPSTNGQAANIVLGQLDFVSNTFAATQSELTAPSDVKADSAGNVWVADSGNARVVKYSVPLSSSQVASIVLGQANYTANGMACTLTGMSNPVGIDIDQSGNLWVADNFDNRVTKYSVTLSSGQAATLVLGQPVFVSSAAICSSTGSSFPTSVAADEAGNIWGADTGSNRLLKYAAPASTGPAASLVLGQPDLTRDVANRVDENGMDFPYSVAVDNSSGRVYVCDSMNNRILWWNSITTLVNGKAADGVLGQPDLISFSTACTPAGLNSPSGVGVDLSGNVWVADTLNNRVLKYSAPITTGKAASLVLGQANFTSGASLVCSATTMFFPYGVSIDGAGNVWVADGNYFRVLKYTAPSANGQAASLELGQVDFNSAVGACTQIGMKSPFNVFADNAGNVWVTDAINNRVLKYANPSVNGQAAALVLGQADFNSSAAACTLTGLNNPQSAGVDSSGNVWIADGNNNRLLKYAGTASNGQAAGTVVCQADFISSVAGCSQTSIDFPDAILFDNTGNLWVSDGNNNRVLRFNTIGNLVINPPVVAATLDAVKAFPNPFNPGIDSAVTIDNLTATADISIYTVAGELVRVVPYNSADGRTNWDGKNDSGATVASGVYITSIISPQGKKRIKIAVEK
jgi:sugar lactone lactonase YvrE